MGYRRSVNDKVRFKSVSELKKSNEFKNILFNEDHIKKVDYILAVLQSFMSSRGEDVVITTSLKGINFNREKSPGQFRHKFFTITADGNKVIFHVPITERNQVFEHYERIGLLVYRKNTEADKEEDKEKNQINLKLDDFPMYRDEDIIQELLLFAYENRK
ncbi:hypothetical protein [Bacillus sp. SM2101]|uniref:hypothetical protein n=1 Tax=Bacillus sp. SM2101 TaxID=2805366 RepID=UPI001BDEBA0E|nr:hypothetical protein [Bacillus sp. SM2101]